MGTGNIVGVALAIYYGGPGAIFWMWITGFLGMMLKLVECTLSLKFRIINEDGSVSGARECDPTNGVPSTASMIQFCCSNQARIRTVDVGASA